MKIRNGWYKVKPEFDSESQADKAFVKDGFVTYFWDNYDIGSTIQISYPEQLNRYNYISFKGIERIL